MHLRELLVGVEGLALLRHLYDGSEADAAQRLAEVRHLLDDQTYASAELIREATPAPATPRGRTATTTPAIRSSRSKSPSCGRCSTSCPRDVRSTSRAGRAVATAAWSSAAIVSSSTSTPDMLRLATASVRDGAFVDPTFARCRSPTPASIWSSAASRLRTSTMFAASDRRTGTRAAARRAHGAVDAAPLPGAPGLARAVREHDR